MIKRRTSIYSNTDSIYVDYFYKKALPIKPNLITPTELILYYHLVDKHVHIVQHRCQEDYISFYGLLIITTSDHHKTYILCLLG